MLYLQGYVSFLTSSASPLVISFYSVVILLAACLCPSIDVFHVLIVGFLFTDVRFFAFVLFVYRILFSVVRTLSPTLSALANHTFYPSDVCGE